MKIVIGLVLAVVLTLGLILALPFLIDLNKYQDQYKPPIEEALNRKVQLEDIRLTIWPRIGAGSPDLRSWTIRHSGQHHSRPSPRWM